MTNVVQEQKFITRKKAGTPEESDVNNNVTIETHSSNYIEELESLDAQSRKAVVWCINKELLRGYKDGTLRLNQSITRAEAAAVVLRLLNMEQAGKISLLR